MILQTKLIGNMLPKDIAGGNKLCWFLQRNSIGCSKAESALVTNCNMQLSHDFFPNLQLKHGAVSGLLQNEVFVATQLERGNSSAQLR
jgi:hypothetical protein